MTPPEDESLLTVSEVARQLRVSNARMYELVRAGLVPAVHLGRQVRIPLCALRSWIANGGAPRAREKSQRL